jgi:hypothetical protein
MQTCAGFAALCSLLHALPLFTVRSSIIAPIDAKIMMRRFSVSRWLGHKDGGALAMKTYGHLRREHSIAQAQRVSFAAVMTTQADVVAFPATA